MRNKKAKAIRRLARAATRGLPEVVYNPKKYNAWGEMLPITMGSCTRLVYKRLKKAT